MRKSIPLIFVIFFIETVEARIIIEAADGGCRGHGFAAENERMRGGKPLFCYIAVYGNIQLP